MAADGGRVRRPRGRRQRGDGECEVVLVNSSGLPQLIDTAVVAARRGGKVAVILNQEHHKDCSQVIDMQAKLKSMHWRAAIAPATVGSGGGNSAGVAILSPQHVGCGRIKECVDISPVGSEGRLALAWVQKIVPCGFVALTAYLHTCEGPSARNVKLLAKALQAAKEGEAPWLLGAGFQDELEAVKGWAGEMVERAGGRWVYVDKPTVYPSTGKPRTIDYFIVSDKLAPFLDTVRIFEEVSTSPHRALLATFRSRSSPLWQWTLRTPKRFPRTRPKGCARHPIAPHDEFLDGVKTATTQEEAKRALGGAWKDLALAVEAEVCGITDRYTQEGPNHKWCGRGEGSRFVKAPVLPARAMGEWGRLDTESYHLLWTINRLEELSALAAIANARGSLTRGQLRQWEGLLRKVANAHCPMLSMKENVVQWKTLDEQLRHCAREPGEATELLGASVAWAVGILEEKRKKHKQVRCRSWWRWVNEQLAKGGGALHRYVKRKTEAIDNVVITQCTRSASAQDIVDIELKGWRDIWCREDVAAAAPWRRRVSYVHETTIHRPSVGEFRGAASKFKVWTGMGTDALPPRVWGWLSDQLIEKVIDVLEAVEGIGRWPHQLEEALVHMIPKGDGGKRPIGLVTSLPRVWARVRKQQVMAWREECSRAYK